MGRVETRNRTVNLTIMCLRSLLLLVCFHLTVCVVQKKEHFVTPTTCGGIFNSSESKSGRISSPNYPQIYPFDIVCHYRFFGTGMERVQITFLDLDLNYPHGDPRNPPDCQDVDLVSVSVRTGDLQRELGLYCGSKRPPILMSPSTQLELTFTSHQSANRGFIANYSFLTNFGIKTGKQDSSQKCIFSYESTERSSGNFTSPNFPGLYPSNTECHFLFYAKDDEVIRIRFLHFDVEGIKPSCSEDTQSDFVEFSNFNIRVVDRKMVRLCGTTLDAGQRVVQSDGNFFRVTFKSNDIYDAIGFKAFYEFVQFEDPLEAKKLARSASSLTAAAVSTSLVFLELVFIAYSATSACLNSQRLAQQHLLC